MNTYFSLWCILLAIIKAHTAIDGTYVNEQGLAFAIACYYNRTINGENEYVISGVVFHIKDANFTPIPVLGWSDNCFRISSNTFILNFQNKTTTEKLLWYVYPSTFQMGTMSKRILSGECGERYQYGLDVDFYEISGYQSYDGNRRFVKR